MLELSLVSSIPLVFKNPFCDSASEGTLASSLVNEMMHFDLMFLSVWNNAHMEILLFGSNEIVQ